MHTSKAPPAAKARVLPPHTPQQRRSYAAVVATVQAVVAGIASHDPGICDRLFTLHYVESINGLKGTAALARCRRSIGAYRGAFKLVRIKQVQGDDRSAIVQFVTSMHAKRANVIFQLVHTGDGWKVHAALRRVK
jgi:hypothetical protein